MYAAKIKKRKSEQIKEESRVKLLIQLIKKEKLKKKRQEIDRKLREEESPIISSVHQRLRSVLLGKTKKEEGHQIIFNENKVAETLQALDEKYILSSDDDDSPRQNKMNEIIRNNIGTETA